MSGAEVTEVNNPFHEIEKVLSRECVESREAVRALLATVHLECCDHCGAKLRSDEFLNAFLNMLNQLKLCHELTKKNAA